MTVAQEIAHLKSQLANNQKQYGRCMEEKDTIAMQYLEQRNRELIDRLNSLNDIHNRNEFTISNGAKFN